MTTLHNYLIRTLSVYHNWHQTKHHNKVHWGVLVVFTFLVFGMILRWTPISFAADTTAPTAPTGLTVQAVSSSQINLSWSASTDDVGVAGYKIYRCAGSACAPTTQIATSPTNSYSNTGLTASTAYTYAVSAYDAANNESNKSTSVSATTQTQTGNIYYVCDTGTSCGVGWNTSNDANLGTSKSAPLKTIKAGIGKLTPGDTLLVGNGIYTGINNMISTIAWNYDIPSGTPGNYITIKAENYLGAVIDGQELYRPVHLENESYLIFQNFHFKNAEKANGGSNFRADQSNHIKILSSASEETYFGHFWFRYSKYILVEDSVTWGRGTYSYVFVGSYGDYTTSQYNVVRRSIARRDAHYYQNGGNHYSSFVTYWADNTYFQNNISIDAVPNEVGPVPDPDETMAVFYTANGSSNYYAEGNISINDEGRIGQYESSASPVTLRNNVVLLSKTGGIFGVLTYGNSVIIENNTFGWSRGNSYWQGSGVGEVVGTLQNAKNNIIFNNRYGFEDVSGNHSYNVLYNDVNYKYTSAGTGEVTNIDPLTNGLVYPVRIEANSGLTTLGESGSRVGAQILKRIGKSGTLYGEPGWNTLTNEDIWPFPNEDVIKTKMKTYNLHGVNGARGFAATGTGLYGGPITLTSYIWEYLGNPCPAGICVATLDTTPPSIPTNPTATAISSSQINLSWTASTDNVGVTGYKIYRCAGSACAPTQSVNSQSVNSLIYNDTGLSPSTAYTYAVSAYDAAGNESGKSGSASATTLSQFKPSDLNQDQKVDQQDFDILKQDFNRPDKPVSDLNQDGIVDSRDLGIMMSEWTR